MRRNDLDLALYLAGLAGRLNAAARRRFGHALLLVRPYRTPAAIPAMAPAFAGEPFAACQGAGPRSPKGRTSIDRNPVRA